MTTGTFAYAAKEWRYSHRVTAIAWVCIAVPVAIKFVREPFALSVAVNGDRYIPINPDGWSIDVGAKDQQR
jgi:hypothetical protein